MRSRLAPGWILLGIIPALSAILYFVVPFASSIAENADINRVVAEVLLGCYLIGGTVGSIISAFAVFRRCRGWGRAIHIFFAVGFVVAVALWVLSVPIYSTLLMPSEDFAAAENTMGLAIMGAIATVPLSIALLITSFVNFALARRR